MSPSQPRGDIRFARRVEVRYDGAISRATKYESITKYTNYELATRYLQLTTQRVVLYICMHS